MPKPALVISLYCMISSSTWCQAVASLLGRNGAGKSTLIKLLAGDITPQAEVFQHQGLNVGYFAQHQVESLDLNASAVTHINALILKRQSKYCVIFLAVLHFMATRRSSP